MTCERVREWLPWYLTGSIDFEIAEAIAGHLRTCDACRAEFVEIARLRCRFTAAVDAVPTARTSAWNRLSLRLGGGETVRVDLGSFLIGLRVGVAARGRRAAVRGDLRIWGRNVRIIGKKRGA
jgi:anti-sigma factor RsiW